MIRVQRRGRWVGPGNRQTVASRAPSRSRWPPRQSRAGRQPGRGQACRAPWRFPANAWCTGAASGPRTERSGSQTPTQEGDLGGRSPRGTHTPHSNSSVPASVLSCRAGGARAAVSTQLRDGGWDLREAERAAVGRALEMGTSKCPPGLKGKVAGAKWPKAGLTLRAPLPAFSTEPEAAAPAPEAARGRPQQKQPPGQPSRGGRGHQGTR